MKRSPSRLVVLSLMVVISAIAQSSPPQGRGVTQEQQVVGYWVDPSTGLMWAGKDNGRDASWQKAMRYCRDMGLARYSDWRLATIDELQGIYDPTAKAPGPVSQHTGQPLRVPFT